MVESRDLFWNSRTTVRFVLLWLAMTTAFYTPVMLLESDGAAGYIHYPLEFALFFGMFLSVPIFERSVIVNVLLALTFYCPALVIHVAGTGGNLVVIVTILCWAIAHGVVQGVFAHGVAHRGWRRSLYPSTPNAESQRTEHHSRPLSHDA